MRYLRSEYEAVIKNKETEEIDIITFYSDEAVWKPVLEKYDLVSMEYLKRPGWFLSSFEHIADDFVLENNERD